MDADTTSTEATQAAADKFRADYVAVRDQVARVVVGQRAIVDGLLTCLFTGGHALLEGVPGIGKTLMVRTLASALSLDFGRVQFTPDLMPADITGTTVIDEVETEGGHVKRQFAFQRGPIFAQMVLADEINRATPKTQSALLEAMQERRVTVAGTTHELPAPFFVLATQNPIEQEGTYPLPEAQLDRFFFKLQVGYASREEMGEIIARTTGATEEDAEPVLDAQTILQHQKLVRRVAVTERVRDYAIRLVLSSHPKGRDSDGRFATPMVNQYVRVGASPRAAQALILGAKCRALVDGRPSVAIEDVQAIALPALRHRIVVNFEAEAEGVHSDPIVENIVQTLPVEGV